MAIFFDFYFCFFSQEFARKHRNRCDLQECFRSSKFYLINFALFVLLRGNHASSRPVGVSIFQAEHD
ncbi:MAG: hypothetical protein ABS34_02430 [Opitutaceae bacterium BACL24 MAG-120322-bin51]|nr:MAG: hypothetical protein ABS34_02430 [Opitutaceae bacterium BACL24 MAG-120322-bin51]